MELIVRRAGVETQVAIERGEVGFKVSIGERVYEVDLATTGGSARSLLIDGRQYDLSVRQMGRGHYEVSSGRGLEQVEVLDLLAHLAESTHDASSDHGLDRVKSYMPGRVVTLLVEAGESVRSGQGILVLEAMKMENEIQAERDGVVREFFVVPGQAVEGGDPLYEIE